ncbi:marginal zone B- and B1-cell-specific protein [Echinops telfairi]|uniref:Marginal zone B- and B1-cell-specific protein n=1 Tax=Echinops telfairi TaxID=9371 RepID=A0ABM0IC21_ECHTE|nr:marginal zone B- and B1-cell-specific protein [Echinops telfairi]
MQLSQALLLLLLGAWAIPGSLGDQAVLTATAPQMDDEEKYSVHMPVHLRCDACRAVAYQMWKHLAEADAKLHTSEPRGQRELSESVYTDVLDRTCSQSWQGYGVQEVNHEKHFIGPGLSEGPKSLISMMVTGGPWPTRLTKTCLQYLGEHGEDRLYETHCQGGREALEAVLCGGSRGACWEKPAVTEKEL